MDDSQIINLYFARDENAIVETKNKYQNMCYSIAQDIFIRRYWYMDPIKKIADRHACGESKIKSILARSRKKLYGLLKEAGYEGE